MWWALQKAPGKGIFVPVKVGTNIPSLIAQRRLGEATAKVEQSLERLGSGLRINRASDDAAGLAIATALNSSARVYTQGIRNINDGISYFSIADAALQQMTNITMRQRELAEQAANGSLSLTQRRALNREANELVKEFNRIVSSTSFNDQSIFNQPAGLSNLTLQAGTGTGNSLSFLIGDGLSRSIASGTYANVATYAVGSSSEEIRDQEIADVNGDGIVDLVSAIDDIYGISVQLGNGDGTFQTAIITEITEYTDPGDIELGDFNGDGKLDAVVGAQAGDGVFIHYGNGNGTFGAGQALGIGITGAGDVELGDLNGDGRLDVVSSGGYVLSTGNGTFSSPLVYSVSGGFANLCDVNGDGKLDILSYLGASINVFTGNGSGSFSLAGTITGTAVMTLFDGYGAADVNGDGYIDVVARNGASSFGYFLGNGNGTFQLGASIAAGFVVGQTLFADMNGDGFQDIIVQGSGTSRLGIAYGDGNGSFGSLVTMVRPTGFGFTVGDLNGDGVNDIVTSDLAEAYVSLSNTKDSNTIAALDLLTQSNARAALVNLVTQQNRIFDERGRIGAYQSRLSFAVNHLQSARDSFDAAAARITDVDVASESAELIRAQILQQSAAAILGQANQQPSIVTQLLKQ